MTSNATSRYPADNREYQRRIRAWTLYDWANSAFATTILAGVLPIYYSQVAGANLPSEAIATSYWSLTLSIALLISAILSPILGTISDLTRGKKRYLTIFVTIGILGTAALVVVNTGDWILASIIMIVARIGFSAANTFYDALLPHVARPEDQDRVSTMGYALGYLGGGLLLAINIVMIFQLGFTEGSRLSFLSVALWWAVFSIPILRRVPEPLAATAEATTNVLTTGFQRLLETFHDLRRYRELFKFLIAFLIYNDAIGTIISVAAIYGTELGFSPTELILALLLVQFVGIPFSVIFGWLPSAANNRRPLYLAFILFNLVALPVVGIVGMHILPQNTTGVLLPPFQTVDEAVGTGVYPVSNEAITFNGEWEEQLVTAAESGTDTDLVYFVGQEDTRIGFVFNGQDVVVTYSTGPNSGFWGILIDDMPVLEDDSKLLIDAYNPTSRYGVTQTFSAATPGVHTLSLLNHAAEHPTQVGEEVISVAQFEVLAPVSESDLLTIFGAIVVVQLVGIAFALLIGQRLVASIANSLNTKRSILLALLFYSVIAVWGFVLRSTIEFWFLAWMVAVVQGGSQALSRSPVRLHVPCCQEW